MTIQNNKNTNRPSGWLTSIFSLFTAHTESAVHNSSTNVPLEMAAKDLDLNDSEQLLFNSWNGDLFDLADFDANMPRHIFSPIYDKNTVGSFLTPQFRENAAVYATRYESFAYNQAILSMAIEKFNLRSENIHAILDLGSGAGNTIIPLLNLFPQAKLISSDLSIELLALLDFALTKRDIRKGCAILQLDAEQLNFKEQTFDLIIGAGILHHLFNPQLALSEAKKVLKTGGHAIFLEPLEIGCQTIRNCFARILSDVNAADLPSEIKNFFALMIKNYDILKGTDKTDPIYMTLDDKWAFTKHWLSTSGANAGFSKCEIIPLSVSDTYFTVQAKSLFTLATGNDSSILPEWVINILMELDGSFTMVAKQELAMAGMVVLH